MLWKRSVPVWTLHDGGGRTTTRERWERVPSFPSFPSIYIGPTVSPVTLYQLAGFSLFFSLFFNFFIHSFIGIIDDAGR